LLRKDETGLCAKAVAEQTELENTGENREF
jgi:hypothetical protein